ncbi:hypothetical protein SFR_1365 [Streptomyces sp. FR-008]|nr:hypothetical protein SFR_1365 [Streptomyces sp. FR-008]
MAGDGYAGCSPHVRGWTRLAVEHELGRLLLPARGGGEPPGLQRPDHEEPSPMSALEPAEPRP